MKDACEDPQSLVGFSYFPIELIRYFSTRSYRYHINACFLEEMNLVYLLNLLFLRTIFTYAGNLNASPFDSIAQIMRAFFAAIATSAFP